MTNEEMLHRLQERTGVSDTTILTSYLEDAAAVVLNRAYPFRNGETNIPVPTKYHNKQLEIAVFMVNKRGAEGETIHIENGTDRHYDGADIPWVMLRDIIPQAKIPGGRTE